MTNVNVALDKLIAISLRKDLIVDLGYRVWHLCGLAHLILYM